MLFLCVCARVWGDAPACACVFASCVCVHVQGMGPSEGIQPGPEAVGDWKDYRRHVEGPD